MNVPEYDETDILDLGMGHCNMKRARSHIHHFLETIKIMVHEDIPDTYVFHELTSRYADTNKRKSKDKRVCIIQFHDPALDDVETASEYEEYQSAIAPGERLDFMQRNKLYYCTCKTGARTVNPCAHGTAILLLVTLIKHNKLDAWLAKTEPKHYDEPMNAWGYKQWLLNQEEDSNDTNFNVNMDESSSDGNSESSGGMSDDDFASESD